MSVLRIWKKFKNTSKLHGVIAEDRITFDSKEDGHKWIAAMQGRGGEHMDFELISYEWALVGLDRDDQFIHENPTGGVLGEVDASRKV